MFKNLLKDMKDKYKRDSDKIVYDPSQELIRIPTGSFVLDMWSKGGLAIKGRLVEFSGLESSGKTTLALQTCKEAIANGGTAIYLDTERTYDEKYANALGLYSGDNFLVLQPRNAEEVDDILRTLVINKEIPDVLVIDSVAATQPQAVLEKPLGDPGAKGLHASTWSMLSPRLSQFASLYNVAVVLINQLRSKIQMDRNAKFSVSNSGLGFGNSNTDTAVTTTGGYALRYYLDARYLFTFSSQAKEEADDDMTGEEVQVAVANNLIIRAIKCKVDSPYRQARFQIRFGKGTDDTNFIIDIAKAKGLIVQSGAWFEYTLTDGKTIRAHGKNKLMEQLSDPDIKENLIQRIKDDSNLISSTFDDEDEELAALARSLEEDAKPSGALNKNEFMDV